MKPSQTSARVPWNGSNPFSDDSLSVQHSRITNNNLSTVDAAIANKCFVDSACISFGPFITNGMTKFAVNSFDHGDDSIRHHFLSKFCRSHFNAFSQFNQILYTTEITGNPLKNDNYATFSPLIAYIYLLERLLKRYSKLNSSQIRVLTYNTPIVIGNTKVTAIEVPK